MRIGMSNIIFLFLLVVLGSPGSEDDPSQALSSLLSRRLNKPVFVGYNCSSAVGDDSKAVGLVHKAILEEVAGNPQFF